MKIAKISKNVQRIIVVVSKGGHRNQVPRYDAGLVPHLLPRVETKPPEALSSSRSLIQPWLGRDQCILLGLYVSLIRSRLDYRCAVYAQTSEARLRIFDSIQSRDLRIASCAFRSSPVSPPFSTTPPLPPMISKMLTDHRGISRTR